VTDEPCQPGTWTAGYGDPGKAGRIARDAMYAQQSRRETVDQRAGHV
jgi:hypothetical protein